MGSIGFTEVLLIFLVILLLFGAKKLPDVAKGMGQALREFRKAAREVEDATRIDDEDIPHITNSSQTAQAEGPEETLDKKASQPDLK
jgi:sec-independent protein translocase protein TatA